MGKIVSGLLMILFSTSAMASDTYLCLAQGPQGKVKMTVPNNFSANDQIYFAFGSSAPNKTFSGTLSVLDSFSYNITLGGTIYASGDQDPINVRLYGTIDPYSLAIQTLRLYGRTPDGKIDKRVDQGFGNILHCEKQ